MGNYTTDNNSKQDKQASAGVHHGVDAAEYHRTMGLTKSGLLELRRSPAHYWEWLNSPPTESSQAMNLGTATHTLLFEPELWATDIAILPDNAPKKPDKRQLNAKKPSEETLNAIKWWEAFEAENADKCIITAEQCEQAKGMVAAVHANEECMSIINHPSAQVEVSVIANEEVDGVVIPCKIRCDMISEDGRTIFDLKSTADASYEEFGRSFFSYGYWMQAAHYIATARKAGFPVERFVFAAVESKKPHMLALYELDEDSLKKALDIRSRLLKILAKCNATGKFPVSNGITKLKMPYYIN